MMLAGGAVVPGYAQEAPKPSTSNVVSSNTAATLSAPAAPASTNKTGIKAPSSTAYASPWVDEVERLTRAKVDEGVVLSYVINSAGTFNLTADQIVRLKKLGVTPQVINAMLQHDQELISGARPLTASYPPSLPSAFQAALTAQQQAAATASAPSATPAAPAAGSVELAANEDANADEDWIYVEPDDVPDQPASAGPVRAPYPVKLNDPIIILKLPTFSVPYW